MKINLKEIFVCLVISFVITWLLTYIAWELSAGWPMQYYYEQPCGIGKCPSSPPVWIDPLAFLFNLIFWFLLVFGSWQLLKFIRVRIKK